MEFGNHLFWFVFFIILPSVMTFPPIVEYLLYVKVCFKIWIGRLKNRLFDLIYGNRGLIGHSIWFTRKWRTPKKRIHSHLKSKSISWIGAYLSMGMGVVGVHFHLLYHGTRGLFFSSTTPSDRILNSKQIYLKNRA